MRRISRSRTRKGRVIVRVPRLTYGKKYFISADKARTGFIQGFMQGARNRRRVYSRAGIKEIAFKHRGKNYVKKI